MIADGQTEARDQLATIMYRLTRALVKMLQNSLHWKWKEFQVGEMAVKEYLLFHYQNCPYYLPRPDTDNDTIQLSRSKKCNECQARGNESHD